MDGKPWNDLAMVSSKQKVKDLDKDKNPAFYHLVGVWPVQDEQKDELFGGSDTLLPLWEPYFYMGI